MRRAGGTVFLVCAALACASAPQAECEPVPADIALRVGFPVYPLCAVDRGIGQVEDRNFKYEPDRSQPCGSAMLEFVIDSTGRPVPATAREVRASDRHLAEAMLSWLPNIRYRPVTVDKRPVGTLVQWETRYQLVSRAPGTVQRPPDPGC